LKATCFWLGCIFIGLLLPQSASAYTRSRDSDTGVCLYWERSTFTYFIHQACSADIPDVNSCIAAVRAGIDVWNSPACSKLNAVYGGTTASREVGFDPDNWNDNFNLIIFQETSWQSSGQAIALTTTTYDIEKGEIVDTDVEFNGVDFGFTVNGTPSSHHDIQNTMAHEAGHMCGLDHSTDKDATMYKDAASGETDKRDLTQDDLDGLCFVYPVGGDIPNFIDDSMLEICAERPDEGCGCAALAVQPKSLPISVLALAIFALFWRRNKNM